MDKTHQKGLAVKIDRLAETCGIDVIAYTDAAPFNGYALTESRRRDPRLSMPDANSIIVAGIYIGGLVLPAWQDRRFGRTSRLYLSGFFLDVVEPLLPIAAYLRQQGFQAMVCIDKWEHFFYLPNLIHLTQAEHERVLGPLTADIPFAVLRRNESIAIENCK